MVAGEHHGINFIRGPLAGVDGCFDLLLFFHVLEHVPDLDAELREAANHLAPKGRILARLPLLPNTAFDEYRENWVQIDAPRHLHIPSRAAFAATVERCGMEVVALGDDSTDFQFWASQAYTEGISLSDALESSGGMLRPYFRSDRRALRKRAEEMNRLGMGDQGWYVLALASGRRE